MQMMPGLQMHVRRLFILANEIPTSITIITKPANADMCIEAIPLYVPTSSTMVEIAFFALIGVKWLSGLFLSISIHQ